jgi:hypothetical protein
MDHLDLPRGRIVDREINYSVPRICHVSKHDFQFIAIADLHRQHYKFATFGILPVCCFLYLIHSVVCVCSIQFLKVYYFPILAFYGYYAVP